MKTFSVEPSFSMAGLNNQKLVLLGLCLLAREQGGWVYLPKNLVDLDSSDISASSHVSFGSVFDEQTFVGFLQRWDIWTDGRGIKPSIILPWKKCFSRGANSLKRTIDLDDRGSFIRSFFSSLGASDSIKTNVVEYVKSTENDSVALQLRIESDWLEHVQRKQMKGSCDFIYYNLHEILRKIKLNPVFNNTKKILICCDINGLIDPIDKLKSIAFDDFGLELIFRHPENKKFYFDSSIKNAIFDFEMCLRLDKYIGLSHSTFSNLLCIQKAIELNFESGPNHYIYNSENEEVKRRLDFGMESVPAKVIGCEDKELLPKMKTMCKDQLNFFEVCKKFPKTDKVSQHGYHRIYPYFLDRLRGAKVKMLEIGVARKGSLDFWRNYFEAIEYWGVDINAEHEYQELHYGIHIIKGDQSNTVFLKSLIEKLNSKVDLILDDGSHVPEHQVATFDLLFRDALAPGGVYIIEDIETSYWKRAELYGYDINYGVGHPKSTIEVFRKLVDIVNLEFTNGMIYSPNTPVSHETQLEIEFIVFAYNCIIVVKKDRVNFGDYYDRKYRGSSKV